MKAFIVKLFKTSEDVACGQMQIATNQRHSRQTSAGSDEPCSRSQRASVGTILRARLQQSLQILPDSQRSRSTLHCIRHLHNAIKQQTIATQHQHNVDVVSCHNCKPEAVSLTVKGFMEHLTDFCRPKMNSEAGNKHPCCQQVNYSDLIPVTFHSCLSDQSEAGLAQAV
jgi:hypothetical protein